MPRTKPPIEWAAKLRSECDSTVTAVRYSTAINAANAIDAMARDATEVIKAFAAIDTTALPEQSRQGFADLARTVQALKETLHL